MPAKEQTWRDVKLMHVIFGVSSLGMLIATIWMLAQDHTREWKTYQRNFRDVDLWMTAGRVDQVLTQQYYDRERELLAKLDEAKAAPLDRAQVAQFIATAEEYDADFNPDEINAAAERAASEPSAQRRANVLALLDDVVATARLREDNASRRMRFARADLDVVNSALALDIDHGRPAAEIARRQMEVDRQQAIVDERVAEYERANTFRRQLQSIIARITAEEQEAQKQYNDFQAELAQLHTSLEEREIGVLGHILKWPILSAFNSPDRIEQVWLPDLTIDYNFSDVARFDRCVTCHQGIDRTAPGSATEPFIEHEHFVVVELATPDAMPIFEDAEGREVRPTVGNLNDFLQATYGMQLSREGMLDRDAITINVLYPEGPAARAGIIQGDAIERVGDARLLNKAMALEYLINRVTWGQPLTLTLRRGLPHPYSSHPRLDLYLGSLSPHKINDFGCTICHEGQGSATAFRWAAHTPNDPLQREQWRREYGWVSNHYATLGITHLWDFPMYPQRFVESSCIRCHHDVVELYPSERFPDPPAPKLVDGYELIKTFGCFGCHEINGYDGPDHRIGPDLRTEPQFYAAALQLLADVSLTDEERQLVRQVVAQPTTNAPRMLLSEKVLARHQRAEAGDDEPLHPESVALARMLGDEVATPGKLRKVGPSLRYIDKKVSFDFLYSWIREPKDFRPTTRMPQFFGQHDHLAPQPKVDEHGSVVTDEAGHPVLEPTSGLLDSERYEPVEIYAITEYLVKQSQPFEYLDMPAEADADRGKLLFETRGCLACHQHHDFPDMTSENSTFGPDLSRLGAKLSTKGEDGRKWLYTWLRNPSAYHARTTMPNLFLDVYTETVNGQSVEVDPAADITEFLFASSQPWEPGQVPQVSELEAALNDLAREYLRGVFTGTQTERYLSEGIPSEVGRDLIGDERLLVGEITLEKKLEYVGSKTLTKYGCAGCHDIPGFELAKPIGTGLADWGRKDTSQLAFELIGQYLASGHADGHDDHGGGAHVDMHELVADLDPDTGFYTHALLSHQREGFIWQKLREPRSYDFRKTENKRYNERLLMPKFPLDDDQIEAIITFVLGLVAEPPASQYVYDPPPRQRAINEGRFVLDQFNCGGCHTLEMDRWTFDFDPATFTHEFGSPGAYDFDFLTPHFRPQEIIESKQVDIRGLGRATVTGMPLVDGAGNVIEDEHPDEGFPVNYFALWKPEVINGETWLVGGTSLTIPSHRIVQQRPPLGGELARYLFPRVLARATDPNVQPSEAWGWVPPPLAGEGKKVRGDWLHQFLLEPYRIRPSAVLRMPKFNMSSRDAAKLVDYFAAVDGADYPYEFNPRQQPLQTPTPSEERQRLADAFKIVTDNNYCVKCHLVGDYVPPGSVQALAPNLDGVHGRLRAEFLERWLAFPKSELPYTGMPNNFEKPAPQELFPGTRMEQLQAVVDLLLNYDAFAKQEKSIKGLVRTPVEGEEAGAGGQ